MKVYGDASSPLPQSDDPDVNIVAVAYNGFQSLPETPAGEAATDARFWANRHRWR